ncbi:hypothetical protein SCUP234_10198 [Seiridium cupressi]
MKLARASLVKGSTPIGSRCAGIVVQGELKDEDDKDTFSHFLPHIQLDNGEMGIYLDLETKMYANKYKLKDNKSWITYADMFEDNTRQLLKEWILDGHTVLTARNYASEIPNILEKIDAIKNKLESFAFIEDEYEHVPNEETDLTSNDQDEPEVNSV